MTGLDKMKNDARRLDIVRVKGTKIQKQKDLVVVEGQVTIILNDVELVTLLCTPKDLEYLAVGFLLGEGLIAGRKDIKKIFADMKNGAVWVETRDGIRPDENLVSRRKIATGCGKALSFANVTLSERDLVIDSKFRLPLKLVSPLMKEFQIRSRIYRATGGVHSAGLAKKDGLVCFNEDIGRHNAVDKVIGECTMKGVSMDKSVLVTSGRISSDIVIKAGRSHVPIILSKSAPTDLAVSLARKHGLTLIGFARGSRMNIYANDWRLSAIPRRKIAKLMSR